MRLGEPAEAEGDALGGEVEVEVGRGQGRGHDHRAEDGARGRAGEDRGGGGQKGQKSAAEPGGGGSPDRGERDRDARDPHPRAREYAADRVGRGEGQGGQTEALPRAGNLVISVAVDRSNFLGA